jgi:hypothetical protein
VPAAHRSVGGRPCINAILLQTLENKQVAIRQHARVSGTMHWKKIRIFHLRFWAKSL